MNFENEDLLSQIANKYASDKGTKIPNDGKHHGPRLFFTTIYNTYFEKIRDKDINLLEIGIGSGPSLKMWYEYFVNGKIHAIDVCDHRQQNNDRVTTYIADQSNRNDLLNVVNKTGNLDLIIDDGSHVINHQQISLGFLFKYLKSGGQYWIEDLHTSDKSVWSGKELYGYKMDFKDGESTVDVLNDFINKKEFNSPFLTKEENQYLTKEIESCEIFDLPPTFYGFNKLALIKKR